MCYNWAMKKLSCIFVFLFLSLSSCFGAEEVFLEDDDDLHVLNTSKTTYLLEEVLTHHCEKGPIDTVHLFGYYRAGIEMDFTGDDEDLGYNFNSINAGINGKFKDGKTRYEVRLRFNPQHDYSFIQYMPSNIYVAHQVTPNNTIILGHTRTPVGYEGGLSMTYLPFVVRSQIGRNFGNVRKMGVRLKGNYDYIEYDIGGYSSDTYFQKFFPGGEFSGWATVKPFGPKEDRYGKLMIGGGITTGKNDIDYTTSGAYIGYEYKNFSANFEYAYADGYNGAKKLTSDKAEGFNTTVGYKITPKLQAVARYDQYTPNRNFKDDIRREYSAGLNYFIKGQALKLMLNYVFCQNDTREDSHRIILGTQILL